MFNGRAHSLPCVRAIDERATASASAGEPPDVSPSSGVRGEVNIHSHPVIAGAGPAPGNDGSRSPPALGRSSPPPDPPCGRQTPFAVAPAIGPPRAARRGPSFEARPTFSLARWSDSSRRWRWASSLYPRPRYDRAPAMIPATAVARANSFSLRNSVETTDWVRFWTFRPG